MARKLKLNIEELSVESFRTSSSAKEERGTVRANSGAISFDATCDCTVGLSDDFNCATDPFGGCSIPGETWGGTRGWQGANAGQC